VDKRSFRGGNTGAPAHAAPPARPPRPARPAPATPEDRPAPRLTTAIHFGRLPTPFRVVADLHAGPTVLVCLGADRAEALAAARKADRPEGARRYRLERWEGGTLRGRWAPADSRRDELPAPAPRPRRRR
jgi:hypothetical protein